MATTVTLPLTLSAAPSSYKKPSAGKASKPVERQVYPAGPSYISYARRELLQISFEDDDAATSSARAAAAAKAKAGQGEVLYPGLGEEEEPQALLNSDPKEWKKQDHYAVLGLGHLRYKATDDHIRVARESRERGVLELGFGLCLERLSSSASSPGLQFLSCALPQPDLAALGALC